MSKNFKFDGSISREVLNSYLSRAVTHFGIGYDNDVYSDTFEDDLRMLKNEGAKFIGRAALVWHTSVPDSEGFAFAKKRIARGHEIDPEFIFQACVFECIYRPFVEQTPIPAYVFETFGLPAEERCFSFDAMKLTGEPDNIWGMPQTAVPDITRTNVHFVFLGVNAADHGFRMMISPWKNLDSSRKFLEYAMEHDRGHIEGYLQTTWCSSGELARHYLYGDPLE